MGQSPSRQLRLCDSTEQRRASTPHRCGNTLQLGVRRPCHVHYGGMADSGQGRPARRTATQAGCQGYVPLLHGRSSVQLGSCACGPEPEGLTTRPNRDRTATVRFAPLPSPPTRASLTGLESWWGCCRKSTVDRDGAAALRRPTVGWQRAVAQSAWANCSAVSH